MKRVAILPLVVFLIGVCAAAASAAEDEGRAKQLERERQKFEREADPVDRAKIGIKISDILLEEVAESVKDGQFGEMEQKLTVYAETIQASHNGLIESGRNASKKPEGFKELEIALRKHVRKLEDFARVLNLQRRLPLEKARDLAGGIRDKLLKALFP
jgi:hypothetical protein